MPKQKKTKSPITYQKLNDSERAVLYCGIPIGLILPAYQSGYKYKMVGPMVQLNSIAKISGWYIADTVTRRLSDIYAQLEERLPDIHKWFADWFPHAMTQSVYAVHHMRLIQEGNLHPGYMDGYVDRNAEHKKRVQ